MNHNLWRCSLRFKAQCSTTRPTTLRCPRRTLASVRKYSSERPPDPHKVKSVVVIGGGITGLVTAFYVAKCSPSTKVVLINSINPLGGWLQSKFVDVGTGKVLFEQGPRTIRPAALSGLVTLKLIQDLGIEDQIISTSKNSPAARNRYVYFPDHLVRMPGPGVSFLENISDFITEPIFRGVLRGISRDFLTKPRSEGLRDETVASFISRRFDGRIAKNILSAIIHGIYAGDINQLSVKSLFPRLWDYESMKSRRGLGLMNGAVFPRFFGKYAGTTQIAKGDLPLLNELNGHINASEILRLTAESSVYTFRNGIGTLAKALEGRLRQMPNAIIREGETGAVNWDQSRQGSIKISRQSLYGNHERSTEVSDYCVYAHRQPEFHGIPTNAPFSRSNSTVTVMVVNMYFSSTVLLRLQGFGYLIPQSVPPEQNPEKVLGVVFDSDATIGQDSIPGTKLTVMLGGHWWNSYPNQPNEDEGAVMAKAVLARHLNITEEPRAIHVALQKDCIPQYNLHHDEVMEDCDSWLMENFGGRVRVGGSPYTGVGLNDCVKAGRDLAMGIIDGTGETGLEMFRGGRKWQYVKYSKTPQQWQDVDVSQ